MMWRSVQPALRTAAATCWKRPLSNTAALRRTPAGSTRRIRSTRTALARPRLSQGAGPVPPPAGAAGRPRNGVAVVVLVGQRQGQQPGPVVSDHQHRTILALRVLLFKGYPGRDDLAGGSHFAVPDAPLVPDRGNFVEVTRICPPGWP